MPNMSEGIAKLSRWIDESQPAERSPEAMTWGRVAKITEEAGEATAALIGWTGQNPRKGVTHDVGDVIDECLDVALSALGAVEHLTGNAGLSPAMLEAKLASVVERAGL